MTLKQETIKNNKSTTRSNEQLWNNMTKTKLDMIQKGKYSNI